jgi:hypothetical protein
VCGRNVAFGPKKKNRRGSGRKLFAEELQGLYTSPYITGVVKSGTVSGWDMCYLWGRTKTHRVSTMRAATN